MYHAFKKRANKRPSKRGFAKKRKTKDTLNMSSLFLLIKNGPQEGLITPLKEGMIIGRKSGDLLIQDDRISRQHAQVVQQKDGSFLLKDLGSHNKLKFQKKITSQIPLTKGVEFKIGKTLFEVIGPEETPSTEHNDDKSHQSVWNEHLLQKCRDLEKITKNLNQNLLPFSPPLILTFISGPQVPTQWILGYGPRKIGSTDLPLWEQEAPLFSFEIRPSPQGPLFYTKHPDKVLLNGQSKKTEILKEGDIISINNSRLKVGFHDENH
ncbi:MAG: FHA domain-containing protein [Bdellovibrio sp.]|nr:MAG: FHA domain-containing protein [Bdellovibrio sp.]